MEGVKEYKRPEDLDLAAMPDASKEAVHRLVEAQAATGFGTATEDLAGQIGGARLNVPELLAEATKIIPSMVDTFELNSSYNALQVMEKIIYFIGPAANKVKKGRDADKKWRLRISEEVTNEQMTKVKEIDFVGQADSATDANVKEAKNTALSNGIINFWKQHKTTDDKIQTVGVIVISTYKYGSAPIAQPALVAGNVLLLTVKQATILGLYILNRFTEDSCQSDITVLTPLAGAIFRRDSIDEMMTNPAIKQVFGVRCKLIDAINKSVSNAGPYLTGARSDVAAVCVIVGTSAVIKPEERKRICQRTVKQFLLQQRPGDKALFSAIAEYLAGRISEEWSFDVLIADGKQRP